MGNIIIKTEEQIEGIKKACKLASDILDFVEPHVIAGTSTQKLDELIHQYHIDHGATPAPLGYRGYPKSICTSINEVICHGIPSEEDILKEGDILNIDVSPILDGYYGDTSRMFMVGEVLEEAKKLVEDTKKCLEIGIAQVREGNYFGNIGFEIMKYALSNGYTVVYQFCGHGVGLDFHEPPQINHYVESENKGEIMKAGMIFTIEPMINMGLPHAILCEQDGWTARTPDRKLSAQWEHTILCTQEGSEVLT